MKNIKKTIYILGLALIMIMSGAVSVFAAEYAYIDGNTLGYKVIDGNAVLTHFNYYGQNQEYKLPSEIDGHPLTQLGDSEVTSVGGNTGGLQKLIVPDTVKRIEKDAFYSSGIKTFDIGTGIEYIGKAALIMADTVVLRCDNPPSIGSGSFSYNATIYVKDTALFYQKTGISSVQIRPLSEYTGTMLSQGSIIIITLVSVIAIVGVVLFVLRRKKTA